MKRLVIVPARSGSKRLKNKNFKFIDGKPMINFTLNNLIRSKLFDTVHVSSDINVKNKIINHKKIDYFLRPKNLSDDKTIINDVVKWVINEYEKKNKFFDTICVAYATAPLVEPNDFLKACKLFEKSNLRIPLLSVCELKPSIDEAKQLNEKKLVPLSRKKFFMDSKKHKKYFYDSASFMFAEKNHFFKNRKKPTYLKYELDRYKGIDINDKNDFAFLKKIFKNKK